MLSVQQWSITKTIHFTHLVILLIYAVHNTICLMLTFAVQVEVPDVVVRGLELLYEVRVLGGKELALSLVAALVPVQQLFVLHGQLLPAPLIIPEHGNTCLL